jgi:hypothetical protein
MSKKLPSIVYILGSGRSGSTLLDRLLGQHESLFSLGEFQNFVLNLLTYDGYCSCGSRLRECTFWARFVTAWQSRRSETLREWLSVQQHVELPKFKLFLRPGWPPDQSRLWETYKSQVYTAFDILAELTESRILVDSSKTPSRALRLARLGFDLRLIHLVRDARGVAWSVKKPLAKNPSGGVEREMPPRKTWAISTSWVVRNHHCDQTLQLLQGRPSIRVRYEDFAEDPAGSLERIQTTLGIPLVPGRILLDRTVPRSASHIVAGNRNRMYDTIKVKPDLEWRQKLPTLDQMLVALIAGGALRRYGYSS